EFALANVLAVDVLLVVERRVGHCDAADMHRLELCPWVEGSGAADPDVDLPERRHRRGGGPLVGARPSRPFVESAEPPLLVEVVDLDHDPVDLVVELGPTVLPRAARLGVLLD